MAEEEEEEEEEVYVGSIDQGTSSTRFVIYDREAKPIASHQVEFTQFYPEAGYPPLLLTSLLCLALQDPFFPC